MTLYIYPSSYRLSNNVFEHLEFALKYEGVNLYILKKILTKILPSEITTYITAHPTGKYARLLWYLYEKFNDTHLELLDLQQGTYITLLDPKDYYTGLSKRSARHRVADNLLGTLNFAPSVRKTVLLENYVNNELERRTQELVKQYDPAVLARAMRYLYTKETMSSWEIERERPESARLAKFVELLHQAHSIEMLSEGLLVSLQKTIVDPRFALNTYRNFQNYVAEEPSMDQLIIHYIAPRPQECRELMQELIQVFNSMEQAHVNPVVAAAILAFAFVYIHPFEDGNGRLHRFLIHYALARLKFSPQGIVFPISATIVRDMSSYDRALETFSKPLMEVITDYTVNSAGEMTVQQDTHDFYRYMDFTSLAEYLYTCVDTTITVDFQQEMAFLAEYDTIKRCCKEVIDMPDQRLDLFIKCVRQNGGTLSSRKRESYFGMLTDAEIKKMEEIINSLGKNGPFRGLK